MKFLQLLVILLASLTIKASAQMPVVLPLSRVPDTLFLLKPAAPSTNTISPDYYRKQLGFFCLKELQVEKAIKVPLKVRLGGLEYCNYLEGKNRQYR